MKKMDNYIKNNVFDDKQLKKDMNIILKNMGVNEININISDYVDIMISHHTDHKGAYNIINKMEQFYDLPDDLEFVNPTHINLLYSFSKEVKGVTSENTYKEDETVCTGEDLFRIYKVLPVNHKMRFQELWLKELKENRVGYDLADVLLELKRLCL